MAIKIHYRSLDLEIIQQECTHSATCTSFPTNVPQIHPAQICSINTCIWQLKIKSVNPFVGHVLRDEWSPYHYAKGTGSANQPKEKDVEIVVKVSKESTLIKSTVDKAIKSPRMMLKPSKIRRTFKWKFPMQLLKKIKRSCS